MFSPSFLGSLHSDSKKENVEIDKLSSAGRSLRKTEIYSPPTSTKKPRKQVKKFLNDQKDLKVAPEQDYMDALTYDLGPGRISGKQKHPSPPGKVIRPFSCYFIWFAVFTCLMLCVRFPFFSFVIQYLIM